MPADLKYDVNRSELVDFVPADAARLLDVGCAGGRYAAELHLVRPEIELWGVEPDGANFLAAREHFHTVVHGGFPEVVDQLPAGAFDVVTFNDVLEHLLEPSEAIKAAIPLLSGSGKIVASIPNVRHRSVVWPLVRHGRWDYEEYGLLDRTHLRFFTRQTMVELFTNAGWTVTSVVGVNRNWCLTDNGERRKLRAVRKIFGDRFDEFFFIQYVLTASPPV